MLYKSDVVVTGTLDVVFTAPHTISADALFAIAEHEAKSQCGVLRNILFGREELISETADIPEESTFIVRMDVTGHVYGEVEANTEYDAVADAENAVEDIGEIWCADLDVYVDPVETAETTA